MAEKTFPSVEQVKASCSTAIEFIEHNTSRLCLDATIDDYPIGRRERGKCRLQVERAKGKGYRLVRTTTDKQGRWCKPSKSTYRNSCIVVVRDYDAEHQVVWLSASDDGVFVTYANYEGFAIAKKPCYFPPRRIEERYTIATTTGRMVMDGNGLRVVDPETVERREHVNPADPPELCDAWGAWIEGVHPCRVLLSKVWESQIATV